MNETNLPTKWRRARVDVGAVRLHYVEAGTGSPVVLLHGFPEFWLSWRRQLPALAEAGFRAVAADLRFSSSSARHKRTKCWTRSPAKPIVVRD
jgi:epoxide hydrolase 4